MFTSLAKLYSSSAMKSRVEKVEHWLKENGHDVTAEFPIYYIGKSNGSDDYSWVMQHQGTHIDNAKTAPLKAAVLAAFGASNQAEYSRQVRDAVQSLNYADIDAKFLIALEAVKAPPTESAPAASTDAPAAAETKTAIAVNSSISGDSEEPAETAATSAAEAAQAPADFVMQGHVLHALSVIVSTKNRNLRDAIGYALSSTGIRLMNDTITARGGVFVSKDARAYLNDLAAQFK